jgi:hypothetical protein
MQRGSSAGRCSIHAKGVGASKTLWPLVGGYLLAALLMIYATALESVAGRDTEGQRTRKVRKLPRPARVKPPIAASQKAAANTLHGTGQAPDHAGCWLTAPLRQRLVC